MTHTQRPPSAPPGFFGGVCTEEKLPELLLLASAMEAAVS
jgi:hypothetical protein